MSYKADEWIAGSVWERLHDPPADRWDPAMFHVERSGKIPLRNLAVFHVELLFRLGTQLH